MHIVIIGNGIAGITAARYIRKLTNWEITVIGDETEHFYSRTALMYIYMGHLTYEHTKPYEDWFWEKNSIGLVFDRVETIDVEQKQLRLREHEPILYDRLLIATGSQNRKLDVPGVDLQGVQGLYGIPDLQQMDEQTKGIERAVVIGGGLIGIEMAEMLRSRNIPVTFLVREESYFRTVFREEEARLVTQEVLHHGINLRLEEEVAEIRGDEQGRVKSVRTQSGEEIPCQWVGISIGVEPNVALAREAGLEVHRGILADEHLQTSKPDIFAAGDCVELRHPPQGWKAISPIWYSGGIQGEIAAANICDRKLPYDPGIYFNSAKFMSVEWQVYGQVGHELLEDEAELYWQHPHRPQSLRITCEKESGAVRGFNALGIRLRQLVCEEWIRDRRDIRYVVEHLEDAFFDPEFYRKWYKDVRKHFNQKFPDQPLQERKKVLWWRREG